MRLPEAADHRVRPVRAARTSGISQEERSKLRHAAAGCRPCGACCLLADFERCQLKLTASTANQRLALMSRLSARSNVG